MNKDLADVLGNFVNRVTKFSAARFGDDVPDGGATARRRPPSSPTLAAPPRRATRPTMEAIEFRKAAQELRALWVAGNEYLQDAAPWTAIKTDPDRAAAITRFSLNLIHLYAVLSRPFIPDAAAAMLAAFAPRATRDWPADARAAPRRPPRRPPLHRPAGALRQARRRPPAELEARFAGA